MLLATLTYKHSSTLCDLKVEKVVKSKHLGKDVVLGVSGLGNMPSGKTVYFMQMFKQWLIGTVHSFCVTQLL